MIDSILLPVEHSGTIIELNVKLMLPDLTDSNQEHRSKSSFEDTGNLENKSKCSTGK